MDSLVTKTDEKGYFSLKDISGRELIFKKENYKTKTVYSSSTQNGEFIDRSFDGDTIYMININSKYYKLYQNN